MLFRSELLVQRQTEIEAWTEQISQLEQESEEQRSRGSQLAETLGVAQEQVEQARIELTNLEREISQLESAQHSVREESDHAHETLSSHEIRLAESRQRAHFLAEEVTREFQVAVAEIDWRRELWRADDEPEGVKPLDLEEEEDDAADSAVTPGEGGDAPKRRRRKKEARGEPTEDDFQAMDGTD